MPDNKTAPCILFVDYYEDSREMMPLLLGAGGRNYDVSTLSTIGEALTAMSSRKFDLLILEYFMPEMQAEQFCRLVRQSNPDIPIIVYGALPSRSVAVSTLAAGADVYLEKPRDLLAIPTAVEILLQSGVDDNDRSNEDEPNALSALSRIKNVA